MEKAHGDMKTFVRSQCGRVKHTVPNNRDVTDPEGQAVFEPHRTSGEKVQAVRHVLNIDGMHHVMICDPAES